MSFVVAVDGPSGSGKSSTARGVADRLGFAYLDTGAMYRAVTWALLQRGVDTADAAAVAATVGEVRIDSGTDPLAPTIAADGIDVAGPIRSDEVVRHVSPVSAVPQVRTRLVDLQRRVIVGTDAPGIVVEGRDIGTVVATDAPLKVFLVADPQARAERRAAEEGGSDTAATAASLQRRDRIDSTRAASPLAKADDAVEIDSTHLSLDEVIGRIVSLVEERR
ncbi:MAG: (d)CMP kinase [Aeromicrobium sp.]|uniref:(d)CMP kinase n=1 Tax=Aeromicrobium sp. TaxID=1871063 RepID=UPI0039E472B9